MLRRMSSWGSALLVGTGDRSEEYEVALLERFPDVVLAPDFPTAFEALESEVPIAFVLVDADAVTGGVWIAVAAAKRAPCPTVFVVHDNELSSADAFDLGRYGAGRLQSRASRRRPPPAQPDPRRLHSRRAREVRRRAAARSEQSAGAVSRPQ